MTGADNHFDLIVIGAGSAGSACWFKATNLGKSVAVFEGDVLGGECPTFACVPTKALLHCAEVYETAKTGARFGLDVGTPRFDYAMVKAWKDFVVANTGAAQGETPYVERGVYVVRQMARFVGPDAIEAGGVRYTAEQFLISTGSSQRRPEVDGLTEAGYLTFKEAIDLTAPPRSLFVMGGGPVGCEFTQLFSTFGTQVTIADRNPRLVHREEAAAGELLMQLFEERGVRLMLGSSVISVRREGGSKVVTVETDGQRETVTVDEVLVATGKSPNTDLGLAAAGIEYDEKGVKVDETLRTTNPRVYAAGDVAGPFRFTHAASYQGGLACANMFGESPRRVDYRAMPRCMFTTPEIASVGMTEAEAREKGGVVRVGEAKLTDVDRALATGQTEGFLKIVADDEGRIVGATVVAPRAGEMLHELSLAISLGATARQVAEVIHAFPTFSEAVAIAAEQID